MWTNNPVNKYLHFFGCSVFPVCHSNTKLVLECTTQMRSGDKRFKNPFGVTKRSRTAIFLMFSKCEFAYRTNSIWSVGQPDLELNGAGEKRGSVRCECSVECNPVWGGRSTSLPSCQLLSAWLSGAAPHSWTSAVRTFGRGQLRCGGCGAAHLRAGRLGRP